MAQPQTVELLHLGEERRMSAHLHEDVVVDPGCERTVHRVVEALGERTPRAILLTHIHFDHAGGTGRLLETYPDAEVWVHERGARHLVDPTRLVASARRVYGDAFEELWGEVVPVPEDRLRILAGGEAIGDWEVAYTPGHAKHHVSYLHRPTATAFTGDVAGIRVAGGPAIPPTPPPDIDVAAWQRSLDVVAAWEPARLAYMHWGQNTEDVQEHLEQMQHALVDHAAAARRLDADGFHRWRTAWREARITDALRDEYQRSSPDETDWNGLRRYWDQLVGERPA